MNKLVKQLFLYDTLAGNGGQDDDPRFFRRDPKATNSEPSYGQQRLKIVIIMI